MSRKRKIDTDSLLNAALALALKHGYREITREQIAEEAGVATGTVNLYFGTMNHLRKIIVRHAVRTENQPLIAQAVIANDPNVKKLTEDQRRAALMSVA